VQDIKEEEIDGRVSIEVTVTSKGKERKDAGWILKHKYIFIRSPCREGDGDEELPRERENVTRPSASA
jgi:hypothetical protein